MRDVALRAEIVALTQSLDAAGLVPNKSGNVSARIEQGFLVTPAGVPYRDTSRRHDRKASAPGTRCSMTAGIKAART